MGRYYPVMLDLAGADCLVVGGGRVAERKVESLVEVGAHVTVVAPRVTDALAGLAKSGRIQHIRWAYAAGEVSAYRMVICATDDARLNAEVAGEARRSGLLVNVVDCAPESNFIVPAVLRRGDLVISVSTGGASPAQARRIREGLEQEFGPEWGPYLGLLEELRPLIIARWPGGPSREAIFHSLSAAGLRELLLQQEGAAVLQEIERCLGEQAEELRPALEAAVARAQAALGGGKGDAQ
jgi:precorrin-2 dehydrogenase/sirohydrochlorin ferrochelatase